MPKSLILDDLYQDQLLSSAGEGAILFYVSQKIKGEFLCYHLGMGKKKNRLKPKKLNKYDNLSKPEAEFDFHDRGVLRMDQVKAMADEFLEDALDSGYRKVLFITGKGLHSRKGMPIIKPFLRKYLMGLPFVQRVYEGRRDRGGSGTLEVVLLPRND